MNSIEWLIEKLMDNGYGVPKEWREQAKHLHKQEIVDAYDKGYLNIKLGDDDAGKEYYKETFEKNKL